MIELGLQRISKLLYDVPLPWQAIHVAGTNGKGSVCSYISEMLNVYNRSSYRKHRRQELIRHGRFTSPHLIDRWDCIQMSIGDQMQVIPTNAFLEIEKAVQDRNQSKNINASEFELLTATAFECFARSNLDIGVVEVGMGGREDATNVIGQPILDEDGQPRKGIDMNLYRPSPLMTAITRIGKDHQQFLGDTYAKIAFEKAGIIKPGVPLTYYQHQDAPEIIDVIRQRAHQLSAPIILPDQLQLPRIDDNETSGLESWRKYNGEIALTCTWHALTKLGRVPEQLHGITTADHSELQYLHRDIQEVIQQYIFPGRQERISLAALTGYTGEVLLDGAHNQQGIELLSQAVNDLRGADQSKPIIYVTAISNSQDRKVEDILQPLLKSRDSVLAVEFGPVAGMPWVEPQKSTEVIHIAESLAPELDFCHAYGKDITSAIRDACRRAEQQPGSSIVICGSLYLAGEVHKLVRDAES
ncbi:putative dihydrofolate synthetase [Pseudocercospora fuligena]|uniref:Putative dihydrofolate synthetase n=1 Tax=Pseudocercospora fuligena TaxID=685502 RepID=A0A8H6RC91_9PEZI|nr:putative dihydrofolate synthetase [Pseudocercospora fuligena]